MGRAGHQMISRDLRQYYADRASEYDLVYEKPERQDDLACIRRMLLSELSGHNVLEIACGTGYWTRTLAETALSVVATDINDEVLKIARSRLIGAPSVTFAWCDAYALKVAGQFSSAVGLFWFSHVPKGRRREFLSNLHAQLTPGALVIFVDNNYVESSNNPMSEHVDAGGNTYSRRRLQDGREFEVLKNFPSEDELRELLNGMAVNVQLRSLQYFWWLSYRIPQVTV